MASLSLGQTKQVVYMEALVILVGLNVVLLLAIGWMAFSRSRGTGSRTLDQRLAVLDSRLESVASGYQDLPRLLADARADQSADVSRQLASFTQMVSGQLDAGQEHVGRTLTDAGELISDVRERLGQLSVSARRIEELGEGVNEVGQLLRIPKFRGTLGEVWLEEMLNQIIPARMYQKQYTFASGERVDAIVRLGDRILCIDAKFPLDACRRMLNGNGDREEVTRQRKMFYRNIRSRVDEIAEKYVRPGEGTFQFALMYVPAERVYHEALAADGDDVAGYALERHVVMVSPHTLYAYLSAMLHGMRGFHVERHAREVADVISALRLSAGRLVRTFETIGRHLDNARKQHGEAARQVDQINAHLASIPGSSPAAHRLSRPFAGT